MGASKAKKARFLDSHPFCCFCGGTTPASTVDHVPARACFYGRAYPEGFEFPACSECQIASRQDELVFSFYVKMLDFNDNNFDAQSVDRSITGLANNLPHLLPNPYQTAISKRKAWKRFGLTKPPQMFSTDLPVVEFSPDIHDHLVRYARKITLAIYYREQKRVAPLSSYIWATWTQAGNPKAVEALDLFVSMTPMVTVGKRINLDFGDRFGYRCNKADKPDVIAMLAQFGKGLILSSIIVDGHSISRIDSPQDWVSVAGCFKPPPAGKIDLQ